jgi:uncharacterized protein (TIGR02757 family)
MKKAEVASFLEEKASFYNHPKFIETDPIQIPRKFHLKEDVEIASFLVASFAWGNRKSIITNGEALMKRMGNSPYDFVLSFSQKDKQFLEGFVHRTFNENDLVYFYLEIENINQVKTIKINNKILIKHFPDQQNLVKTTIGKTNKSVLLNKDEPFGTLEH